MELWLLVLFSFLSAHLAITIASRISSSTKFSELHLWMSVWLESSLSKLPRLFDFEGLLLSFSFETNTLPRLPASKEEKDGLYMSCTYVSNEVLRRIRCFSVIAQLSIVTFPSNDCSLFTVSASLKSSIFSSSRRALVVCAPSLAFSFDTV